jgi:hypothetical protein
VQWRGIKPKVHLSRKALAITVFSAVDAGATWFIQRCAHVTTSRSHTLEKRQWQLKDGW